MCARVSRDKVLNGIFARKRVLCDKVTQKHVRVYVCDRVACDKVMRERVVCDKVVCVCAQKLCMKHCYV